eukprot:2704151-Amphidinium_carterae.1
MISSLRARGQRAPTWSSEEGLKVQEKCHLVPHRCSALISKHQTFMFAWVWSKGVLMCTLWKCLEIHIWPYIYHQICCHSGLAGNKELPSKFYKLKSFP